MPMPSAATPMRLSSGRFFEPGTPNHQRASYSRKPVGLTSGRTSNGRVFGLRSVTGFGNMRRPFCPVITEGLPPQKAWLLDQHQAAAGQFELRQAFEEAHAEEVGGEIIAGEHGGLDVPDADPAD